MQGLSTRPRTTLGLCFKPSRVQSSLGDYGSTATARGEERKKHKRREGTAGVGKKKMKRPDVREGYRNSQSREIGT